MYFFNLSNCFIKSVDVKALVREAIWKSVMLFAGAFVFRSDIPYPWARRTRPSFTALTVMDGLFRRHWKACPIKQKYSMNVSGALHRMHHGIKYMVTWFGRLSKLEVPRNVRNSKSGNIISSGENSLNIRTNASPKLDRTRSKRPLLASQLSNLCWHILLIFREIETE